MWSILEHFSITKVIANIVIHHVHFQVAVRGFDTQCYAPPPHEAVTGPSGWRPLNCNCRQVSWIYLKIAAQLAVTKCLHTKLDGWHTIVLGLLVYFILCWIFDYRKSLSVWITGFLTQTFINYNISEPVFHLQKCYWDNNTTVYVFFNHSSLWNQPMVL